MFAKYRDRKTDGGIASRRKLLAVSAEDERVDGEKSARENQHQRHIFEISDCVRKPRKDKNGKQRHKKQYERSPPKEGAEIKEKRGKLPLVVEVAAPHNRAAHTF